MPSFEADYTTGESMNRANVLRVLTIGFSLVIILLAAVAYIGSRRVAEIRRDAAALLGDQLIATRLVDQLEAEQQRIGDILLRISRYHLRRLLPVEPILRDAEASDREVQHLVQASTHDRPAWERLGRLSDKFARSVRDTFRGAGITAAELETLMEQHDEFVRAARDLIRADSTRAASVEAAIGKHSSDLTGESGWLLAACFLLAAACAGLSIHVTNDSFRKLEWQAAELSKVSWHMLQGQEAAARRFSHEMHDELGQSLTGLKTALGIYTPEEFGRQREDCIQILEKAIQDVRELSQLLRPVILDDLGLDAALRWLSERFEQRTRIAVEYVSNFGERLAEETETHLFRVAQESLTNVARHSGASRVRVTLARLGDLIRLTIEDDGKGIQADVRPRHPGLGMTGMRARASHAGGDMRLDKSPLGGVKIELEVPFREPKDAAEPED
jgi:signal transduction histidine kinase